jgi:hypothetical protein
MSWKTVAIATALAAALAPVQAQSPEAPRPSPGLDSTRETISKWIATQDMIFRETKDWQEQKELITARIEALEQEIASAEAKLAESRGILADFERKKAEAAAAERELASESDRLLDTASSLEADVKRLHELLPPAVQEKVAPLLRRIPEDPKTARVSAGERFQNVVGILNEIHKANGEISLVTEIRPLSDGKPSEVRTVYVGLGQAYFLSAQGEAGIGRPTADGWKWQAANELAQSVSDVIEILENKGKPKFVPLPVTVQ